MDCKLFPIMPDLNAPPVGAVIPEGGRFSMRSITSITTDGKVGGRDYVRQCSTDYVFNIAVPGPFGDYVTIDSSATTIGVQTEVEQRAILEEYARRGGTTFGGIGTTLFDHRAMSFFCGLMVGLCLTNRDGADRLVAPAVVMPLAERNRAVEPGHYVLTRALYRNAAEYSTLLGALGACGITQVWVADNAILPNGNAHGGLAAAQYFFELHLRILEFSNRIGCGAPHELCYAVGLSTSYRLNSHCDEGGYVRRLLMNMRLPPPQGICETAQGPIRGWDPRGGLGWTALAKFSLARLLALAVAWNMADEGVDIEGDVRPTMLRYHDGEGRPSSVMGLRDFCLPNIDRCVNALAHMYDLLPTARSHAIAHQGYFNDNLVDEHLVDNGNGSMCPGFWIETGPLTPPGVREPVWGNLTVFLGVKETRLLVPGRAVAEPGSVFNHVIGGVAVEGSETVVDMMSTSVRKQGFRLLLSTAVNGPEDGLALFSQVDMPLTNRQINRPLFMRANDVLGQQIIVTPHNPFPLPFEGLVGVKASSYLFISNGRKGVPTYEDLNSRSIKCSSGRLRVENPADGEVNTRYANVGVRIDRFSKTVFSYEVVSKFHVNSFGPMRLNVTTMEQGQFPALGGGVGIGGFNDHVDGVGGIGGGLVVAPNIAGGGVRPRDPGHVDNAREGGARAPAVIQGGVLRRGGGGGNQDGGDPYPDQLRNAGGSVPSLSRGFGSISGRSQAGGGLQRGAVSSLSPTNGQKTSAGVVQQNTSQRQQGVGANQSRLFSDLTGTKVRDAVDTHKAVVEVGHTSLSDAIDAMQKIGIHEGGSSISTSAAPSLDDSFPDGSDDVAEVALGEGN